MSADADQWETAAIAIAAKLSAANEILEALIEDIRRKREKRTNEEDPDGRPES